jgi:hypothetical protein
MWSRLAKSFTQTFFEHRNQTRCIAELADLLSFTMKVTPSAEGAGSVLCFARSSIMPNTRLVQPSRMALTARFSWQLRGNVQRQIGMNQPRP